MLFGEAGLDVGGYDRAPQAEVHELLVAWVSQNLVGRLPADAGNLRQLLDGCRGHGLLRVQTRLDQLPNRLLADAGQRVGHRDL